MSLSDGIVRDAGQKCYQSEREVVSHGEKEEMVVVKGAMESR